MTKRLYLIWLGVLRLDNGGLSRSHHCFRSVNSDCWCQSRTRNPGVQAPDPVQSLVNPGPGANPVALLVSGWCEPSSTHFSLSSSTKFILSAKAKPEREANALRKFAHHPVGLPQLLSDMLPF